MSDQSNNDGGEAPRKPTGQAPPDTTSGQIQIPAELESVLRKFGVDVRDVNASKVLAAVSLTKMVSGALPFVPPAILQEYKNVSPELVGKLVEWTETQAKHRRDLETLSANRSENRLDRGQWIAGAVALGGLSLAAVVGIIGNPYVAAIIAIFAIGGPTAAILLARNVRGQQQRAAQRTPGPQVPAPQPPSEG
jgi:hypothetical protein